MRLACRNAILVLLAFTLAELGAACGEADPGTPDAGWIPDGDLRPPDAWDPGEKPKWDCSYGYGEDCPAPEIDCRDDPCIRGACIEGAGPAVAGDSCLCETGYAGLLCDRCASGYEAQGLSCMPSDPCRDSSCVYGTCQVWDGGRWCACDVGYAGSLCDACAEGYHLEDLACVPD